VLSDAEALCSRVGILAGGRLVASGRVADLQAFDVHGWDLVVSSVSAALLDRYRSRIERVTPLGDQRYSLELPLQPAPELLLADFIAGGAQLVSLNPMRDTLEDFFVKKVGEQAPSRFEAKKRAAS
jgi:ABC-2 type transport system ATP-binding protein